MVLILYLSLFEIIRSTFCLVLTQLALKYHFPSLIVLAFFLIQLVPFCGSYVIDTK